MMLYQINVHKDKIEFNQVVSAVVSANSPEEAVNILIESEEDDLFLRPIVNGDYEVTLVNLDEPKLIIANYNFC